MLDKSLWVIGNKKDYNPLLNYSNDLRNYQKGSFIYRQEDKETNLFFILNGRIKVSILNTCGSEKTLAIHEPGSFFGETAFFDKIPCHATACALKDSDILVFNESQFLLLLKEQPGIMHDLFQSLARKIRLLSFQVEYLSFMNIEQRVVAVLLSFFKTSNIICTNGKKFSKKICNSCTQGNILNFQITDQEIADMIGTRRESVTKVISSLRKKDLIYKQNRMICCPSLSNLEDVLLDINTL